MTTESISIIKLNQQYENLSYKFLIFNAVIVEKHYMENSIYIFENSEKIAEYLVGKWFEIGKAAQQKNGNFITALSGGSTPEIFYNKLSAVNNNSLFWSNTHIFQVDERLTPHGSSDNNFKMINELLLDKLRIPYDNLHRMETENCCGKNSAEEYENKLRSFLKLNRRTSLNFDLILLGLGEDGHTASLFPDSIAINEENHLISFVDDCNKAHDRITMTFPLINRADNIFFMIIGENKAEIVKKVLENKKNMFPANQVAPVNGSCLFLLDKSAASLLSELD